MTGLRLALFDVDGTLVDSQGHIVASMEHAFDTHDLTPPTRADILSIVGLSLPQAMMRLAPKADADALAESYKAAYVMLRQAGDERALSPLYPGISDVLDRLRGAPDMLIGVATGKSRRGLRSIVDAHDLSFLVTRQVADDHPSKPHPSMVLAALAETGVEADQAVMIGDTTYDMEMGQASGVKTLGVGWGYHPIADLAPIADHVVHQTADLFDAIMTLSNGDK